MLINGFIIDDSDILIICDIILKQLMQYLGTF